MRSGSPAFVGSIATSAFLLFLVQPMIAKMALPWFGGGPAVWNTCLLFFQTLLLAGYAYSHFGDRLLGTRRHMLVHGLLLLLPLVMLPPVIAARFAPTPGAWPVPALLVALLASVGLPFFVLSTNSSLVQRWFTLRSPDDPYFLYAASNAASLCALGAYPLLIEPRIGLRAQATLWAAGYLLFVALTFASMFAARRASGGPSGLPGSQESAGASVAVPLPAIGWPQRGRWVFRAAVASGLLLAVSLRISTDLAAVPLLWTVPLGIYLASFIIAFLPRAPYPRDRLEIFAMFFVTLALTPLPWGHGAVLWLEVTPPLGSLFLGCWICHGDLARDRPPPAQLTEFYLWISVGGFLGGLFGNIVAPLLFKSVAEYPITLALLAFAFALRDRGVALFAALQKPITWLGPAAMAAALALSVLQLRYGRPEYHDHWFVIPLVVLLIGMALWQLPGQFPLACATVAGFVVLGFATDSRLLEARRSFFGVLRVSDDGDRRMMVHGTTLHGIQIIDPLERKPVAYYHPKAPMSAAVLAQKDGARIGVVGLGAGSIAALTRPGQRVTYFEIDPAVEPMARGWFTFLADAKGEVETVLGDARLTLARVPDQSFDLLVMDAFSSDAIPVHLLTVDALRLYLDKLTPHGVLLVHISNRYMDLSRVLRGGARTLGVRAAIRRFQPDEQLKKERATPSVVVAVSRDRAAIEALEHADWKALEDGGKVVDWSDDRSSLLGVIFD
ncbi:MAG: hypothetical protein EXR72_02255 [Myxococcales bacterium]|nr:hypothetical protein [Myxococcales bacterium]